MKSKRAVVILNICKQRSPKCIYDEMCLLVLNWAQLQLFHFFNALLLLLDMVPVMSNENE